MPPGLASTRSFWSEGERLGANLQATVGTSSGARELMQSAGAAAGWFEENATQRAPKRVASISTFTKRSLRKTLCETAH